MIDDSVILSTLDSTAARVLRIVFDGSLSIIIGIQLTPEHPKITTNGRYRPQPNRRRPFFVFWPGFVTPAPWTGPN
jgi:hypothetical protein